MDFPILNISICSGKSIRMKRVIKWYNTYTKDLCHHTVEILTCYPFKHKKNFPKLKVSIYLGKNIDHQNENGKVSWYNTYASCVVPLHFTSPSWLFVNEELVRQPLSPKCISCAIGCTVMASMYLSSWLSKYVTRNRISVYTWYGLIFL